MSDNEVITYRSVDLLDLRLSVFVHFEVFEVVLEVEAVDQAEEVQARVTQSCLTKSVTAGVTRSILGKYTKT